MNIFDKYGIKPNQIGFVAIILTWIAAGFLNSLLKLLNSYYSAEELLIIRSIVTILVAGLILGDKLLCTTRAVFISGFLVGCSSIGFYRAIQVWDVNPVCVAISFMPLVNIGIAYREGRHIAPGVYLSAILLIGGVFMALEPWRQDINLIGMLWVLSSVVAGGIGFDLWGKLPSNASVSERCLWFSVSTLVLAVIFNQFNHIPLMPVPPNESRLLLLVAGFIIVAPAFIFLSIVPFTRVGRVDTVKASILLQGATPATLVGAYFLVDARMNALQLCGVGAALGGASLITYQMLRTSGPPR